MRPIQIERADDLLDAVRRMSQSDNAAYLAGGTTMVDLLKLEAIQPDALIDLSALKDILHTIEVHPDGLHIGAMATMSEVAGHALIQRHHPVVADALWLGASGQIRNMATIGGNLLQRTRCGYFRDLHARCNKRQPGSGCAAIGGLTRPLAILGTSPHCIANYPGDLAIALVALDATMTVVGANGKSRTLAVEDLYCLPGDTPHHETILAPGDLITEIILPATAHPHSLFLKIRDRASYAFALASAAVSLELDAQGCVRDIRIAIGGLSAKPWRCRTSEQLAHGKILDQQLAEEIAELALAGAQTDHHTHFKVTLGKGTIIRALLEAKARHLRV